jgi:hypothetical protein
MVNALLGPAAPKDIKPVESSVGVLIPDCCSSIDTALEQSSPSYAEPEIN